MAVAEQVRVGCDVTAAEFGLTAQQARALLHLSEGVPMRALADGLGCDASNITGIADRLQARGLVRREARPTDRRVKLLVLTTEGERVRTEFLARLHQTSPVLTALTAAERATLQTLLGKLLDTGQ
jgi:DNA-binding MarR family transcriptional regulator